MTDGVKLTQCSPDLSSHISTLDGLRGVAILLVMMYHQTILESRTFFDKIFLSVTLFGWSGVDLFFVLSGFLITGILYDSKESRSYFPNFYARRALRIFPLYYAVLFFSLVILPQFSHPKMANFGRIAGDEIWYWLYLSNFSIAYHEAFRHGILDISWSLAIEEQFYIVWPAVVLFFSRRAMIGICISLIVIAPIFRTVLLLSDSNSLAAFVLTPSRMDALAVGALIALLARGERDILSLVSPARKVALITGLMLLSILIWQGKLEWNNLIIQTIGYTILAFFFGAFLVLAASTSTDSSGIRILNNSALRMFGRYSYALYLFHLPVRAFVRDTFFGAEKFPVFMGSQLPGQVLFYAIATVLTLVPAILSWFFYEARFLKLKKLFPIERKRGTESPALVCSDN